MAGSVDRWILVSDLAEGFITKCISHCLDCCLILRKPRIRPPDDLEVDSMGLCCSEPNVHIREPLLGDNAVVEQEEPLSQ